MTAKAADPSRQASGIQTTGLPRMANGARPCTAAYQVNVRRASLPRQADVFCEVRLG